MALSHWKKGEFFRFNVFVKSNYRADKSEPAFFFQFLYKPSLVRGHSYKIKGSFARENAKKFLWPNRIVEVWNNLPAEVMNNWTNFRNKLDPYVLS